VSAPRWRWLGVVFLLFPPLLFLLGAFLARPLYPTPDAIPAVPAQAVIPEPWRAAAAAASEKIRFAMAAQNLPAVSVAVGVGNELVWASGFGYAELWTMRKASSTTRYRLGEVESALANAALESLTRDGPLPASQDMRKAIPALQSLGQQITIQQLRSQQARVLPDDDADVELFTRHCDKASDALAHYAGPWRVEAAASRHPEALRFSWLLLSMAMEASTGESYAALMHKRVFETAGMQNTRLEESPIDHEGDDFPLFILIRERFYDAEAVPRDASSTRAGDAGSLARYYVARFRSQPRLGLHTLRPIDLSCYAGSGSVSSTAVDLLSFAQGRLSPGTKLAGSLPPAFPQGRIAALQTAPAQQMVVAVMSNATHADAPALAEEVLATFARRLPVAPQ
jgi:CubicO group peptidase (beta-lactamase class C family)